MISKMHSYVDRNDVGHSGKGGQASSNLPEESGTSDRFGLRFLLASIL